MPQTNRRTFPETSVLTPMQVGRIHRAASLSDEKPAQLTALISVIACDAYELASVLVSDVNRATGDFRIMAADGSHKQVALGFHGAIAIHNVIAGRRDGFLLSEPQGTNPLKPDLDTLDYARQLVSDIDPGIDFPWSFRSIRECLVSTLMDGSLPYAMVEAQMGLGSVYCDVEGVTGLIAQRAAADWLAVQLGLGVVSPFELIDLAGIAADAFEENQRLRGGRAVG